MNDAVRDNLAKESCPSERPVDKSNLLTYTSDMMEAKKEKTLHVAETTSEPMQSPHAENFSLAHLSDLHLTTLEKVRISQLLNKRIFGYFSWLRKRRVVHRHDIVESLLADLHCTRPDHIAITGDLTHLGLPDEFAEAGQWLISLGNPEQVTVIPGNHEAYSGRGWAKACTTWTPYLASDTQGPSSSEAGLFPSLRIRGQVALIGLCSARPSLPLLAIGSLGENQLGRLEALLRETGDQGLFRIILIHHPPVTGTVTWRKRLVDSKAFTEVLVRHGAELVLHGHAHMSTFSVIQTPSGGITVVGTPSASELNPGSGVCAKYNIYQLKRNPLNWELTMFVRGYSEVLGRFVPQQETVLTIPR